MLEKKILFIFFLVLFFSGLLYGSSYQQFRHFDLKDPKGGSDSLSYIRMSRGNYNVGIIRRYRFITPYLASKIRPFLESLALNSREANFLAFYIINFIFMLSAAMMSFFVFYKLGFNLYMSLLGGVFFICSRITASVTGMPVVDSVHLFSIASIIWLTEYNRYKTLCILNPLFILSKETTIPFLFIPFFKKKIIRRKKIVIYLIISLILALGVHVLSRKYIDSLVSNTASRYLNFVPKITLRVWDLGNFKHLLSLKGLIDITNGFSTLLVFSALGLFLNKFKQAKKYSVPFYFDLTILIALGLAFVSGNLGRMLFSANIAIITYALIGLEFILEYFKVTFNNPE